MKIKQTRSVLTDQLISEGTDRFAQSHFFGAFCSTRCGKIDKIEADENVKQSDDGHHVNIIDISSHFELIIKV